MLVALALLLTAHGCSTEDPSAKTGVTYTVPSGGGSVDVKMPSGNVLTFTFPASAAGKTVTLTPAASLQGLVGKELKDILRMEPEGTTFVDPVVVRPSQGDMLLMDFGAAGATAPGEILALSPERGGFLLNHFSTLGVVFPQLFCNSGGWTTTPGSARCAGFGAAANEAKIKCDSNAFCFSWELSCCKTTATEGCSLYDQGVASTASRLYAPPAASYCGTAPPDAGQDTRDAADTNVVDTSAADTTTADTSDTTIAETAADTAVSDTSLSDASADTADTADTNVPRTYVRVATFVPDLGGALDFCIAPFGGAFTGPYMASVGEPAALAYPQLSEHVGLAPGSRYTIRAVAAGATDCNTPLIGTTDVTTATAALVDERRTIALVGERAAASPDPVQWRELLHGTPATGADIKLRVFHAAPALGPIGFGSSGGVTYGPHLTALPFGTLTNASHVVSGAPAVDALGYLTSPRYAHVWSARTGTTDVGQFLPDTWQLADAFVIGKSGSTGTPLGVASCHDPSQIAQHRSLCQVRTGAPTFPLRIVHLAADAPAVDICLKDDPSGTLTTTPLLRSLGHTTGLALREITQYFNVPAGTDYRVALVPTAATTCTGTELASGNSVSGFSTTLELLETNFGTPAYQLAFDFSSVASTNNGVNVRFRNAVPGFFNVNFAATPAGGTAANWFTNVAPNLAGISYVEKTAATYSWQIRDALSPNTVRATSSNVVLAAGEAWSTFFHQTAAGAYALLRCNDAQGMLTRACNL